ncbi:MULTISPECIES: hypothetical protein [Chitinophagaceae]
MEGKMYIASQRGIVEDGDCRMQCTLNYADYYDLHKGSVKALHHLFDVQLKKNANYTFPFKRKQTIVVIALYNSIVFYSIDDPCVIVPGEVFIVLEGMAIRIQNNSQDDVGSFL